MSSAGRRHLLDFQARLTERLRQATTSNQSARLGLMIGDSRWLVDLNEAGEIVPVPETIAAVPLTRDWFRGLANLRGSLIAISDLSRYSGGAFTVLTRESRVLALSSKLNFNAAILITRMLGLHNVDSMQVEKDTETAMPPWVGRQLIDQQQARWTELKLSGLLADEQFLMVSR